MNYAGKFDAALSSDDQGSASHPPIHLDSIRGHAPADAIVVPDAHFLFNADFKRSGLDLILSKDDHEFVLHDYFRGDKRAALASPDGAHLTGDIVNALSGAVQVSQAGAPTTSVQVIGHVTKLAGSATAIRNGVSIILNMGDNVAKADVVQAGSDSTLGITFIDGTVFGLSSNARMVLNEMVYDPNGSNNSSLLSLVAGTITFVAGETAKHGDMKVDTPVATMGIRGTAVLVEIDFTVPNQNTAPDAKFQVLVEPDGTTGSYILFDKTTLQPLAVVNQAGQQINISNGVISQTSAPLSPEIQKLITDVFSLKFSDLNTNPKTTTAQTDTINPLLMGPIIKLASGTTALPQFTLTNTSSGSTSSTNSSLPFALFHLGIPPTVVVTGGALDVHSGAAVDSASGTIRFADVNAGDRPTATATFSSFTLLDPNGNNITSTLAFQQVAAVAAPLVLSPSPGNTNNGSVGWTYSIADSALSFLTPGERLTLTYQAKVDNNYTPLDQSATETFTITITGVVLAATISLSGLDSHGNAVEGQKITATVTSPGAPSSGIIYTWTVGGQVVPNDTGNSYTPTENDQGKTISVAVSFTDTHGFAETGTASAGTVTGLPEVPNLTVTATHGAEGSLIALNIAASGQDPDDTVTITITGVPSGAKLANSLGVAYAVNSDGSYTLTPAQLGNLYLDATQLAAGPVTLSVTATNTSPGEQATTNIVTDTVTVDPVAPNLTVTATHGAEGSLIALNIAASGHELGDTVSITITGVPSGAKLANSFGVAYAVNSDGSYTLTPAQLGNLYLDATKLEEGQVTLNVTATTASPGQQASTSTNDIVTVNPVAGPASLAGTVTSISGGHDTGILLPIVVTPFDSDDNISIKITGVPDDAVLTYVGITDKLTHTISPNGNGSYTLTMAELNNLTFIADEEDQSVLHVTITSSEGSSSATSNVDIAVSVDNHWTVASGDSFTGAGTIAGSGGALDTILNDGTIVSTSALNLHGNISGTGLLDLNNGALMELGGSVGSSQGVFFNVGGGSTGELVLDSPGTFQAKINGFNGSDTIDLKGLAYSGSGTTTLDSTHTSVTVGSGATAETLTLASMTSTQTVIHVSEGGKTSTLTLAGNYTGSSFVFSSDGSGGTQFHDPPATTSPTDPVVAGAPNQTLTGLAASDTFVFNFAGVGKSTVSDFHPDTDLLQFKRSIFVSAQAVLNATHDDGHGNAVVAIGAHDSITLDGVAKAQLHTSDFHIV